MTRAHLFHSSLALLVSLATAACSADSTTKCSADQADCPPEGVKAPKELAISLVEDISSVPPAGIKLSFQVLTSAGDPLKRRIRPDEVQVINNESGGEFDEGGFVSDPAKADEFRVLSVLILDMSESIFENDVLPDVLGAAEQYIDALMGEQAQERNVHRIALIAFGRSAETEILTLRNPEQPDDEDYPSTQELPGFESDRDALFQHIDNLRESTNRGGTNLYGAYELGMNLLSDAAPGLELVERTAVIVTDGTHEAGDKSDLRSSALDLRNRLTQRGASKSFHVFSIGVEGAFQEGEVEELATSSSYFIGVEDSADLSDRFDDIATRVQNLANSKYTVGICTPVEFGSPAVTLRITVDDPEATGKSGVVWGAATWNYSVADLDGDVRNCDPEEIADQ